MTGGRIVGVSVSPKSQCPRWPPQLQQQPLPRTPAWPGLVWPGLASPHLTGAALPTPASAHLPDHTSAHAQRPPPQPSGVAELAFRAFPPCAATVVRGGGRRGRGHGWEVGKRAQRPSVVVSWLRAAVAEWLQL